MSTRLDELLDDQPVAGAPHWILSEGDSAIEPLTHSDSQALNDALDRYHDRLLRAAEDYILASDVYESDAMGDLSQVRDAAAVMLVEAHACELGRLSLLLGISPDECEKLLTDAHVDDKLAEAVKQIVTRPAKPKSEQMGERALEVLRDGYCEAIAEVMAEDHRRWARHLQGSQSASWASDPRLEKPEIWAQLLQRGPMGNSYEEITAAMHSYFEQKLS